MSDTKILPVGSDWILDTIQEPLYDKITQSYDSTASGTATLYNQTGTVVSTATASNLGNGGYRFAFPNAITSSCMIGQEYTVNSVFLTTSGNQITDSQTFIAQYVST